MSIILIGFMAVGKSTIGQELAKMLQRPFIDLDEWIEKQEKHSISTLFDQKGEAYFRQCEYQALKQWQDKPVVIATGGGIVTHNASRTLLKKHQNVIGLELEEAYLMRRLNNKDVQATRPLLKQQTPADILSLYRHRLAYYYEVTDNWFIYSNESPKILAEQIILFLKDKTFV
ncbi:shikimate kinase [Vagococcus lutrae]|uniref:shikimate kinase n=1 Tax=Vagococcus lutrae TaxID=81947 RepID=UPI0019295EF7|nr:shikimate kinase [Vagococcus lutrae]UQF71136.1 shikimate kinase [Vagococcus lutrae]GEQ60743.1 shikimate kinase [Vagococcus lutrae]GEQ62637.1 shikimate kinase [Vagococcus lutrae]GEQ64585.1 shikimate kinase [Vagococcus lutrae]